MIHKFFFKKVIFAVLISVMLACDTQTILLRSTIWSVPTQILIKESISTPIPIYGTVTAERLEIRSGAGTEFTTTGYLYAGQTVIIYGNLDPATPKCKAGWLWIGQGYVCAEYVK